MCEGLWAASVVIADLPRPEVPSIISRYILVQGVAVVLPPVTRMTFPKRSGTSVIESKPLYKTILKVLRC